MSGPIVLSIETSCDETAASVLDGSRLLSSCISSQTLIHRRFGGVVPEVASRNHLSKVEPLVTEALEKAHVKVQQIDCVAATRGPGLLTSLLVGYSFGKGLAIGLNRPFIGVNHIEAHLLSPFFRTEYRPERSIGLVVSGGHTLLVLVDGVGKYQVLGGTVDDAAGEAFDKVAKLLGLPYPGGPQIDALAPKGDPGRYDLPRPMVGRQDFNFSFSGIKTAVRYLLPKLEGDYVADVAASFQEAVVDVLVRKTIAAAAELGVGLITVSGGVSCNSRLRQKIGEAVERAGKRVLLAQPALTTDNAAMIGYVAIHRFRENPGTDLALDADPNLTLGNTDVLTASLAMRENNRPKRSVI
ncbi:MAG: tRNA (adenosine(37)-N6)-threonylcarbamoyltransferase complex transferase subunit TsaD [Verrucomicrobia bacterium]|nr:tRNA (adenosine(37)-N6)-threonylcarbamoyltransferase complex transferase subunit TsaD [Verrucomicrobiota bacterium]MBV8486222.1 tRNA (adenosine(37)-N6)-threonylcarbamoyltransferase complex transferase subunit TsaD [Verrucomicrobiota bacterium]